MGDNPFRQYARRSRVAKMSPDPSALHVIGSGGSAKSGCGCGCKGKKHRGRFKRVQTW